MTDTERPERPSESSTIATVLKALGTMLGVHIQYAQREAADDLGRVAGALVMFVLAALFALVALLIGHAALVFYLSRALHADLLVSSLWVFGGDVLAVAVLALAGRARIKRPILEQTRTLVRRTVTSMVEL